MSDVWDLLKKSLPCKSHSSDVHDPKSSKSTERKKQGKIENSRVKDESNKHEIVLDKFSGKIKMCPCYPYTSQGKAIQESHSCRSTKPLIPSTKTTHFVDYDECSVLSEQSKVPVPLQKYSNDPPKSTPSYESCEGSLEAIHNVQEPDIPKHSVIQLDKEDSSWKIIEQVCQDKYYMDSEIKVAGIECVLRVENNEKTYACFEECRTMVRINVEMLHNKHPRCLVDGNELLRFHGSTIACSLGINGYSTLCTLDQCGVCQILRHGFSANQEFQGALGVFTTSTSGKAIDSICSSSESLPRKCVIVCRVIAGKILNPLQEIQEISNSKFDSLVKKISDQSEIEELMVLNPRAILPCFVVIYEF
ncbi:hypothetical protein RJT34_03899 [Clitoria ternatea]|uniref:Uncharacterized protein n=1 Tax=Clitoria ternatea TaxID=43366 RepID=A0AAN9KMG9_CLITE